MFLMKKHNGLISLEPFFEINDGRIPHVHCPRSTFGVRIALFLKRAVPGKDTVTELIERRDNEDHPLYAPITGTIMRKNEIRTTICLIQGNVNNVEWVFYAKTNNFRMQHDGFQEMETVTAARKEFSLIVSMSGSSE